MIHPWGHVCRIVVSLRAVLLIVLPAFALPSICLGQMEKLEEEWRWVNFTTESRLPSNQIFDVAESPDGIVWAATSLGIAWFDGFQWHSLPDSSGSFRKCPASIASNQEGLLLAVFDGLLYECSTGGIRPVPLRANTEEVSVQKIVPSRGSGYILQGLYTKLFSLHGIRFHELEIPAPLDWSGGRPVLFSAGSRKEVWIYTTTGIYRLKGAVWQRRLPPMENTVAIGGLTEADDGSAFISIGAFKIRGLWQCSADGGYRRVVSEGEEFVRTMDVAPSGDVIAVYQSGDIRVYHGGEWSSLTPPPAQLRNTTFLKYRSNGDLWVGSESGLYLHRSSSHRWTYWKHPFGNTKNYVNEIIRTKDGSIWTGSFRGVEVRRSDGTVSEQDRAGETKLGLITGLCQDDNGGVWASSGHDFEGAYRWESVAVLRSRSGAQRLHS